MVVWLEFHPDTIYSIVLQNQAKKLAIVSTLILHAGWRAGARSRARSRAWDL